MKSAGAFPYLLLVPALVLTLVIVAYPLADTVRLSFTDASLRPSYDYVGLENYADIFGGDFTVVMLRTFLWVLLAVVLKVGIGLYAAVLLNAAIPGQKLARILSMLPWIIPVAIGAFIWKWMYNGQFGMISGVGQRLGLLDGPLEFLAHRNSSFVATVLTDVWVGVPMVALFLLAAMQSIPKDLYEAAWTDGASRLYRFRRITLPLLKPSLATITLLCVIWSLNSFDIIWILTEGGPRDATTTMIVDTYKTAISRYRYGEGAARAIAILVCVSVVAGVYFSLAARRAPRESGK
ncbi:carbohydrate ABC transporter permease [Celeribacter indicus]|uniref:Binding-protein-dependent transport systems inner membrane component n=1 Tax=Celeribacter indicus TaxID=1208324 RepID=A0A0B5E0E8_9RHOB|nr:sugar ABC transporter permease [Celeribacter indicus]AJE48714.1 binding-protein-dependent transport systems inner membrane component [Celeribacter indicus]SDX12275.1 carbohydrate ABC transporter membrane protein 1, CUT1 family [Celeribacter indicus]